MNKLMIAALSALSFTAFAQEPANEGPDKGPAPKPMMGECGCEKPGPGPMAERGPMGGERGPMSGERGPMAQNGQLPRGGMNAALPSDPAVMAVLNPRVAKKIGLTEEVQAKIKAEVAKSREANKALQEKTRAAMQRQAELMKAATIDEGAVMGAIDELFELRKEMAKVQTRSVIAVKALLTPEQLQQALEGMKEMREARRGRMNGEGQKDRMHGEGQKGPKHGEGAEKGPKHGEGQKDRMHGEGQKGPKHGEGAEKGPKHGEGHKGPMPKPGKGGEGERPQPPADAE